MNTTYKKIKMETKELFDFVDLTDQAKNLVEKSKMVY